MDEYTILKYLNNTASQSEIRAVKNWIAEKKSHQEEFERLKKLWETSEQLSDYQSYDTNAAWNKIQPIILVPEASSNSKPTAKRIPLPNQNSSKSNRSFVLQIAAGFLVFLMVGFLFYALLSNDNSGNTLTYKTVESKDSLLKIPLSDGSVVSLNQYSTLKYPTTFSSENRKVILTGEAFFEVAENRAKPFIIEAGATNIKVLGTSFNVNSANQEHIEVTVASGKVQFYSKEDDKEMVVLEKGEKGLFENNVVRKDKNTDPNFLSWKTGILEFKNQTLSSIFATTYHHYGIKILIDPSSDISHCKYTSEFDNQSIEAILKEIADYFGFTYIRNGDEYVLKGDGCD